MTESHAKAERSNTRAKGEKGELEEENRAHDKPRFSLAGDDLLGEITALLMFLVAYYGNACGK